MTAIAPLSYGQELFWLLDNATPGLLAYNVPRAFRIHGAVNAEALKQALNALVTRHQVLRSVYALQGDHPVQRVMPDATVPFEQIDLRSLPVQAREAESVRVLARCAEYHFDLAHDVLLRATLLRLDDTSYVLCLLTHHIVSDGWSKSITFRDLSELYAAFAAGREPQLGALPMQFAHFATRQRASVEGAEYDSRLAYWREKLRGPLPQLDIHTDRARPVSLDFAGDTRELVLPKSLVQDLRLLGQHHGATLYMVLLAAYQTLLHRYSGQDDIIVGSPTAGRDEEDTHDLIGYFAGALVLRTSFADDPTFAALLERVSDTCLDAYEHQDIPFEKLVLELQKGEALTHAPLFQCVLTMEDTIPAQFALGDARVETSDLALSSTKFDLVLLFSEHPDGLRLRAGFRTALFDGDRIERFLCHLNTLLASVAENAEQRVSVVPLLTQRERHDLLHAWNETSAPMDVAENARAASDGAATTSEDATNGEANTTVVAFVEQRAREVPARVAVVGADATLTWDELNTRANRIASWLVSHGASASTPVGICLERSSAMIAALLGVLKSGAPYVALLPDLPPARLAQQLHESGARHLVANRATWGALEAAASNISDTEILLLDRDAAALDVLESGNLATRPSASDLAYVLFTSGSTGTPKGVAVTHGNLLHYVRAISARLSLDLNGSATTWSFATVSTLGADLGHTAVFPALCSGGTLHVVPEAIATDGTGFAAYAAQHAIDVLKITPNHLRALLAGGSPDVLPHRWLVLGGEALQWNLANELVGFGRCRVLNHYGPTETTVGVCTFEVNGGDSALNAATVPIGRPLRNTSAHVLDAHGELVPIGVAGELYIGGDGVTQGYFHREDLTRERFVEDRFSSRPGARLYRTGDRVRRLANGLLEFLGRTDHQVKVRGNRVELGEVDHVVRSHPAVDAAAVVLRTDSEGNARLVAYLTIAKQAASADRPTADVIQEWVRSRCPEYMVPDVVVVMEQLPLTANGKVNHAALPEPEATASQGPVAPRTATERKLLGIWSAVLKKDEAAIGVTDSFLDLGGHSLLAIRVLGRVSKDLGVRLALRALFETPTIEQLATIIDAETEQRAAAQRAVALDAIERLSDAEVAALLSADGAPPESR